MSQGDKVKDKVKVTAAEVIETITDAMREGVEPLAYSALAPSHYYVLLNTEDYERLAPVFPRVVAEARRKLDQELKRLNGGASPLRWLRRLRGDDGGGQFYESADGDWFITFYENSDDKREAGAIEVSAELALPDKGDVRGTKTKVVTVRRSEGATRKISESLESRTPSAGRPGSAGPGDAPRPRAARGVEPPPVYARLSYQDGHGRQVYSMTKNQIVIGRGGVDYWVDLRLDASEDVSREHLRLRRDSQTGKFYVKDMSTYGTTLDGRMIEASVEVVEGAKRDKNVEVELPKRARLGLAGALIIDFEET